MRLRYAGSCASCGTDLAAGSKAVFERSTKTVRCIGHVDLEIDDAASESVVESGTPGASARTEFERRKASREQRIRTNHPKLGGLIHAVSEDPQSTTAWNTGAKGEERLGARLNELVSDRILVLHDRRIPGSRANIDHVAVTPSGIYVIDAKKYRGRPHLKIEGGLIRPRVEKLMVGTSNRTELVEGMLHQVDVVRGIVGEAVAVHGVLCFIDADWPLVGGAFETRGIQVLSPKKLCRLLARDGELAGETLLGMHRTLASALPVA
jgi:hypothetical protein